MNGPRVLSLLLLLLFSLTFGAKLQGNEVFDETKASAETGNAPSCPSDAVLRDMGAKLTALQAKLETLDQRQAKVEQLQKEKQVERVAFFASLLPSDSDASYIGPFRDQIVLIYRNVFTNIGNAYNPDTGMFRAPVRGAYHFEFYIYDGRGQIGTAVKLAKNGEEMFSAKEMQMNGVGTAANGGTLVLEAGDVVYLQLWNFHIIYDIHHVTTFSGRLLFPL